MEWLIAFRCRYGIAMVTVGEVWHEIVDGVIGNASLLEANRPSSKIRGRSRTEYIKWRTSLLQTLLA